MKSFSRLTLLFAVLSVLAVAKPLQVKSHTGSDAGFLVNSHLISGEKEAILVDAQFLRSEAEKVIGLIKRNGKPLTAVYITHPHPDHYFGLEIIKKYYPKAKIYAHPDVLKEIRDTAEKKVAQWKEIYKDMQQDLVDRDKLVYPVEYSETTLTLEGKTIELHSLKSAGESTNAVVVYLPETKELISGDLIYQQVHLWLAEDKPEGWLKNLEQLNEIGQIKTIYPGHGASPGNAESLVKDNANYIRAFVEATKGTTRVQAIAAMTAKYPTYKLPIILELSVNARVPQ